MHLIFEYGGSSNLQKLNLLEIVYELWKNAVRTTHGICAVDELRENRGASWRRFWRAQSELYRAIPRHGFCTADLPRESAACLLASQTKLYSMGFRAPVKRSTLADANEARNWHIWEDLATLLIRRARKLYCNDSFGVDLTNTVYALDAVVVKLVVA